MKEMSFLVYSLRVLSEPLAVVFFVAALGLVSPTVVAAEEEDDEVSIALEKLPTAVKKALKLAVNGREAEELKVELEDGMVTYEAKVEVKGGCVELKFDPDGRLVGIEIIEADDEADDDEAGDDEAGDDEVGDDEVGDDEVGDDEVGESEEGDDMEDAEEHDHEGDEEDEAETEVVEHSEEITK